MTSPLCVATGGWCRRVFHYRPPTPMYRNSPPLCTIVLQIPSLMPLKMRKVQLAAWLETPQKKWHEAVPWSRLPWHGLAKTKSGSHATLLGITIHCQADSDTAQWQAVSVGDCCAFITGKQHSLLRAFPTDDPDEFGNNPSLICSNPARNGPAEMAATRHQGLLHTGERIILATDAAAQWLLKTNQGGQAPWQDIAELTQDGMEEWVKSRRQDHGMKNDDVTITVIDAEHEEPEG